MRLFSVNKNTGEINYANEFILTVKEFRDIVSKYQETTYSNNIMLYVFFMADWTGDNWLAGLSEKELRKAAIKESRIDENLVDTKLVKDAITCYIEIQQELSPTVSSLITAKKALRQAGGFIKNIANQNEVLQSTVKKLIEVTTGENNPIEVAKIMSQINTFNSTIKSNIEDLLKIVNTITKSIGEVDKLEQKVRDEYKEQIERVGSKKFGMREKPGYNIKPK